MAVVTARRYPASNCAAAGRGFSFSKRPPFWRTATDKLARTAFRAVPGVQIAAQHGLAASVCFQLPLRPESECERPHARIARHQGQHVPSSCRTGDEANHARPIEARHSVCTDVCTVGVADWLPV